MVFRKSTLVCRMAFLGITHAILPVAIPKIFREPHQRSPKEETPGKNLQYEFHFDALSLFLPRPDFLRNRRRARAEPPKPSTNSDSFDTRTPLFEQDFVNF